MWLWPNTGWSQSNRGPTADTEAEGFKSRDSCEQSRSRLICMTCLWKHRASSAIGYWLKRTVSSIEDTDLDRMSVREFVGTVLNRHTDQEEMNYYCQGFSLTLRSAEATKEFHISDIFPAQTSLSSQDMYIFRTLNLKNASLQGIIDILWTHCQ